VAFIKEPPHHSHSSFYVMMLLDFKGYTYGQNIWQNVHEWELSKNDSFQQMLPRNYLEKVTEIMNSLTREWSDPTCRNLP
jgi:hypothetical protein